MSPLPKGYFYLFLKHTLKIEFMDFENDQWDQADKDFVIWLNENNNESNLEQTNILKATYLTFRQKQIEKFKNLCEVAFDFYQEQIRINIDNVAEESQILFRMKPLSESELMEQIHIENFEIIQGILSGDQQTFNNLYEDEFPKVVRLIEKNSGNINMAKDIFQDALIVLIEKVYSQNLDLTCSISTYLYSIGRFLWMDQLRKNKRLIRLDDSYDHLKAEVSVAGFENAPDIYDEVHNAIESLGDPCKKLLECFYYQNLGWDEIAQSLGYSSAASARNQKYKCLERIRGKINIEVS